MYAEREMSGLGDNFFSTLLKRAPQIIIGGATGYVTGGGIGAATSAAASGFWDTGGKVLPMIGAGVGTGLVVGTATGAAVEASRSMLPSGMTNVGTGWGGSLVQQWNTPVPAVAKATGEVVVAGSGVNPTVAAVGTMAAVMNAGRPAMIPGGSSTVVAMPQGSGQMGYSVGLPMNPNSYMVGGPAAQQDYGYGAGYAPMQVGYADQGIMSGNMPMILIGVGGISLIGLMLYMASSKKRR